MPVVAVVYATFFFSCGMWCALLPVRHRCTYSQSTKPRGSSGFILSLFFVVTDKKKISLSFMASVHRMYT